MTLKQQNDIKISNQNLIIEQGYTVNQWLPIMEEPKLRTLEEIKGRIAIMNAVINIAFDAPTHLIKNWIIQSKLTKHLAESEQLIIDKPNDHLGDIEVNSMSWYLESLWALMWVTKMIDSLEPTQKIGDSMASLLPDLEEGEGNQKIEKLDSLRSELEIYTMLDYYYRLHWYCEENRMKGLKTKLTDGVIYERRKALEWVFNRDSQWDNIDMST
jgi:hypothetical protein